MKTLTAIAASFILMTAVSAQAAQSDVVTTDPQMQETGMASGSNSQYVWEKNAADNSVHNSSLALSGEPDYSDVFSSIFVK